MAKNKHLKLGIVFITIWILVYMSLFLLPFLGLEKRELVVAAGGITVVGEIFFWVGAILAGKEYAKKYISFLSPLNWFKKDIELEKNNKT